MTDVGQQRFPRFFAGDRRLAAAISSTFRCCQTSVNSVFLLFIRCSSSDESRLDGDEGLRGAYEELIQRMSNAYLTDKKRTKNGQLKDFAV